MTDGHALAPAAEPVTGPGLNAGDAQAPGSSVDSRGLRGGRLSRRGLKNWRVRSRLLLLIVIPTLTALVLGGVRIVSSVQSALAFRHAEERAVLASDIRQLAQRLETERDQTVYYIALGSTGRAGVLSRAAPAATKSAAAQQYRVIEAFYRQTDQAIAQFRTLLGQFQGCYSPATQQEVASALAELSSLRYLRQASAKSLLSPLVVIKKYADLIDNLIVIEDQTAQGTGDPVLSQTVEVLGLVSRMKEEASQQRGILSAALLQGTLAPAEASALASAQANQQSSQQAFDLFATGPQLAQWNNTVSGSFVYLAASEEQQAATLQARAHSLASDPITADSFYDAMSSGINDQMGSVERSLATDVITRSESLRRSAVASAILVGLAVFIVLALALMFTVMVGRSLVRPLRRLRMGALQVAGVRLPETVSRMSEGPTADVPPGVEPIDVDSADEIGDVARAFDQVHREAVRLASNEAALRGNVNAMFVNLSRRSQSLVERQIRLIDDLEQGEQDSERLANLFQMDHLATRMRRNSENLLVLAGQEVSRRWTQAVALMDVLRAAVSEIEQYERVALNVQPGISVRGQVVSDVVHLLSELVENATSFSAAGTPVNVSGQLLTSGGVLLDVTDQGVGMGTEEMAHANWRLDNPPVVDVAVSRRMGLFVVARLAARHGIRVRLRHASLGGLTALVWLPEEVISHDTAPAASGTRRVEVPATGALGAMGRSLAARPAVGQPEDRAATVQALTAARTSGFTPPGPDLGDTASFSAIGSGAASSAIGSGTEAASSVDLPAAEPVADGELPPATQPEQRPVFGSPLAGSASLAGTDPGFTSGTNRPAVPSFGTESGQTEHGVIVPPAVSAGEENRLPIFESVESDWFRRGRHGIGRPAATWTSPADEGWRAAEVAYAPVSGGMTGAGLPKRVPKANLVPGGVGAPAAPSPPADSRSALQTRDRLASFQRGVREARAASGEAAPIIGEDDGGT